jgi:membrane associated rhomboid family serine protease
MLLPFRAKNPPERFPFVTLGLIVTNLLIYLATADHGAGAYLSISEEGLRAYALFHETLFSEPWRILSSMFLHSNVEHILGNMLFLWIFGASLEGRLKPVRFLILYLAAGVAGDVLQDLLWGSLHPGAPSLGASGAIMGVAGGYLYAFPYSFISVFFWGFYRIGVWDIHARWVVLVYVGMDVLSAVLFRGGDGVGHMAHLGGFGMGLLLAFLMRTRRDSEEASYARAAQSEGGDYSQLDIHDLETLLEQPTEDMKLVMAYCGMVVGTSAVSRYARCLSLIYKNITPLMAKYPPDQLAHLLLGIPPAAGGVALTIYLRLATLLERSSQNDLAFQLYRRVCELAPSAPDAESALFRQAQLMQNVYHNTGHAQSLYQEMLRRFPNGIMAMEAHRALQQLGPNVSFYRGSGAARLNDDDE